MDQSSPSWRVFDAPAAPSPGDAASATGSSAPGLTNLATAQGRLAIAGAFGALAIGGLAVFLALSGAGGQVITGPDSALQTLAAESADGASEVVVDVTGAVMTPGVYHLIAGSRVGDAIEDAGGFSARVDAGRVASEINLAAVLTDGEQVRVPSRDDETAPGGGPGNTDGGGAGAGGSGGAGGGLIDLNTASQTELESLPGIGPVTAGKILESRAGSRFVSVDELRERGLVGEKTFEAIRALVTVG